MNKGVKMIYLIDWVQEGFKLDTIMRYIGLGLLGLMIIVFIIALIIAWIKER